MERVLIPGEAGELEAELECTDGLSHCAVACHPHPLYGGTMHDAVVGRLCEAATRTGMGSLRFNFRGVGASTGVHDKGIGEVDDLLSVVHWLREVRGIPSVTVCGYSFGAIVALSALARSNAEKSVLIAPPVRLSRLWPVWPCSSIRGETCAS